MLKIASSCRCLSLLRSGVAVGRRVAVGRKVAVGLGRVGTGVSVGLGVEVGVKVAVGVGGAEGAAPQALVMKSMTTKINAQFFTFTMSSFGQGKQG